MEDKHAIILQLDISKPSWNLPVIYHSFLWLYETTSDPVLFTSQYIIRNKTWCYPKVMKQTAVNFHTTNIKN